jgi:hypothetical protein
LTRRWPGDDKEFLPGEGKPEDSLAELRPRDYKKLQRDHITEKRDLAQRSRGIRRQDSGWRAKQL